MHKVTQTLNNLGLSDKESALYLASLSLGESNMTRLAQKSKLKRSTAYKTFENLREKGLMGSFKMSSGMRFVANKPSALLSNVEKTMSDLKDIMPELLAMDVGQRAKPRIRVFKGVQGYRDAVEDSLRRKNNTLRHIGSHKEVQAIKSQDYDLNYYMPKRIEQNIFLRSLYFATETDPRVRDVEQHKFLREIRYLPQEFYIPNATLIYDNKVIITATHKELVTIMIENEAIAEGERKKFDLIWSLVGRGRQNTSPQALPENNF